MEGCEQNEQVVRDYSYTKFQIRRKDDNLEEKNTFIELSKLNMKSKLKQKGKFDYLSWASAWDQICRYDSEANFKIHEQIMDEFGNTRPWFSDGISGWVKMTLTVCGKSITDCYSISDTRFVAIPVEKITSSEAINALKRLLVKLAGYHGLALYVYDGEDLPEEYRQLEELHSNIMDLISKKCKQSETVKKKVGQICKDTEKDFYTANNITVTDEEIVGNPRNITDITMLQTLQRKILAIRK
jgi:hypothetical protein